MAHGGTFVRPGALAWGPARPPQPGGAGPAGADSAGTAPAASAAAVEDAMAAAARDPDRVTGLLDALRQARLWLPLPEDDGPVTDGSAVQLPTVTYLGAEFIPAFTSAERMAAWPLGRLIPPQAGPSATVSVPHIVVAAAELARLLPPGVGIALNPGAETSVPVYPEGIGYITLLGEVGAELRSIPEVRHASRAWLSVPGSGEGLVISVALRDPASEAAHHAVIAAVERAATAVPHQFPIDVTFPGENAPDQVEEWIAAHAEPFYVSGGTSGGQPPTDS